MVSTVGTITGEHAFIYLTAHSGGCDLDSVMSATTRSHSLYGMGEFSVSLGRGTIEQDLIGQAGNYHDQGKLTMDGSLTMSRFGSSGNSHVLLSIVDGSGKYEYLAISGSLSNKTDATYLKWYLLSCQVTGYDVTIGDADAITEANVDFMILDPHNIEYTTGLISDRVKS